MKHGVSSPAVLKEECRLVGQAFKDDQLGHFLWEIVSLESESGLVMNQYGGVCNISFELFKLMKAHHCFDQDAELIYEEFGVNLPFIQYQQLHMSPNLSLIFAAVWLRCYYKTIPAHPVERAYIFSQYWRYIEVPEYLARANVPVEHV